MKVAFFIGTRPGIKGLGNRAIRLRLRGEASHCELVFEPGDGVDSLMPDGTCAQADGALWCASSVASEKMPAWSSRRPGRLGGVRFKRIAFNRNDPDWVFLPIKTIHAKAAAQWFAENQGALYDWQYIVGFLAWPIPEKEGRVACSEAVAAALGFYSPWRFDPMTLLCALKTGRKT